jgi:hypothetical protein
LKRGAKYFQFSHFLIIETVLLATPFQSTPGHVAGRYNGLMLVRLLVEKNRRQSITLQAKVSADFVAHMHLAAMLGIHLFANVVEVPRLKRRHEHCFFAALAAFSAGLSERAVQVNVSVQAHGFPLAS